MFYEEMHKDGRNVLTKFQVNPIYRLRDMDKTILLQEHSKIATRAWLAWKKGLYLMFLI